MRAATTHVKLEVWTMIDVSGVTPETPSWVRLRVALPFGSSVAPCHTAGLNQPRDSRK